MDQSDPLLHMEPLRLVHMEPLHYHLRHIVLLLDHMEHQIKDLQLDTFLLQEEDPEDRELQEDLEFQEFQEVVEEEEEGVSEGVGIHLIL